MTDHRARYGPAQPRRAPTSPHAFAEQLVDLGEVRDELRHRRRPVVAGAAAHPRPDRVVVGVRGGDAAAGRALPGVRRRPPRPGPQHPHAGPLHARQHRQRPRPLHRRRDRAADDRERPVVRRRAVRLAVGLRQARPGAWPRCTRTRRCSRRRSGRPSVPASASPSARCSTSGAPSSATSGRSGRGTRCARAAAAHLPEHMQVHPGARRAAAEPQGVRPRVGPGVLDAARSAAVVRPRADAAQRQGALGAAHPPHARHRRDERLPASARCPTSRPSGCRTSSRAPASTVQYRSFPDVGHSMHGDRPELYVETLFDWVDASP